MKILCACHRAKVLTGSEVYFLELTSALSALGHDVTLAAPEISQYFFERCQKNNVKLIDIKKTKTDYDLIIISHYSSVMNYIKCDAPIINIIHSEIYPLEVPFISQKVKKYVGIRQPICDKLTNIYRLPQNKVDLVRNPIDLNKFNTERCTDGKNGLFVGTLGGLRIKALIHFSQFCKVNGLTSIYIGPENEQVPFFDKVYGPCENIEKYFKNCTVSGGIIHGRTYFEAKLCGKKTIEYFVNQMGTITDIQYEDETTQQELLTIQNEFDKLKVAERIIQ